MRAILKRKASTEEGTFGELKIYRGESVISLATAELPWKNNLRNVSCVPEGTYECSLVGSPRFGRVYAVKEVPGRSHILIHGGNFAGDKATGLRSDVEGCILVGLNEGLLYGQRAVLNSKQALSAMLNWCNGNPFQLSIKWSE